MKKKINVRLPNGEIIERVPRYERFGNFVQTSIVYKGNRYWVGDGDEHLRGAPEIYELNFPSQVDFRRNHPND